MGSTGDTIWSRTRWNWWSRSRSSGCSRRWRDCPRRKARGPPAAALAARRGEPPRTRRRAGSNGARAIDAVGLHPYVGYLPPHCQPFRHLTTCAYSSVLPSSASPQPRPAGGNARAPGVEASPITNPTTHARSIPPSRPTCRRAADVNCITFPVDSSIAFSLTEPLAIFPKFLAMPVASVVPAPPPGDPTQGPVGTGPWRFVAWQHDDYLLFARNPSYWGGAPAGDTLTVRIIPEPLTRAAEFEAGRLSVIEVPFGETARWRARS